MVRVGSVQSNVSVGSTVAAESMPLSVKGNYVAVALILVAVLYNAVLATLVA